jgi:hypothetical protein
MMNVYSILELQEQNKSGTNSQTSVGRLVINDESTLSRYVAARLDLQVSQDMIKRNFKLSIVKRCWEDQLRLKGILIITYSFSEKSNSILRFR